MIWCVHWVYHYGSEILMKPPCYDLTRYFLHIQKATLPLVNFVEYQKIEIYKTSQNVVLFHAWRKNFLFWNCFKTYLLKFNYIIILGPLCNQSTAASLNSQCKPHDLICTLLCKYSDTLYICFISERGEFLLLNQ